MGREKELKIRFVPGRCELVEVRGAASASQDRGAAPRGAGCRAGRFGRAVRRGRDAPRAVSVGRVSAGAALPERRSSAAPNGVRESPKRYGRPAGPPRRRAAARWCLTCVRGGAAAGTARAAGSAARRRPRPALRSGRAGRCTGGIPGLAAVQAACSGSRSARRSSMPSRSGSLCRFPAGRSWLLTRSMPAVFVDRTLVFCLVVLLICTRYFSCEVTHSYWSCCVFRACLPSGLCSKSLMWVSRYALSADAAVISPMRLKSL